MYNRNYDDYVRKVLGYSNYKVNNKKEEIEDTKNKENDKAKIQITKYYPDIYNIVYPMINKRCRGVNDEINDSLLEDLVDEIYYELEGDDEDSENIRINVDFDNNYNSNKNKEDINTLRQRIRDIELNRYKNTLKDKKEEVKKVKEKCLKHSRVKNKNIRDLIKILIIRELLKNN